MGMLDFASTLPLLRSFVTEGKGSSQQQFDAARIAAYGLGGHSLVDIAGSGLERTWFSGSILGGLGYSAALAQQSFFGIDELGVRSGRASRIIGSNWDNVMNSPVELTSGTSLEELVASEMGPNAVAGIADLPPAVRNMMKFELMQQRSKRLTEFYSNFAHLHHKMIGDVLQNMGRIA